MRRGKPRKLPPLTADHLVKMLALDGWRRCEGTKHLAYEHPDRAGGGKVSISAKWTGLKFGSFALQGVMAQAGWSKDDVRRLYSQI